MCTFRYVQEQNKMYKRGRLYEHLYIHYGNSERFLKCSEHLAGCEKEVIVQNVVYSESVCIDLSLSLFYGLVGSQSRPYSTNYYYSMLWKNSDAWLYQSQCLLCEQLKQCTTRVVRGHFLCVIRSTIPILQQVMWCIWMVNYLYRKCIVYNYSYNIPTEYMYMHAQVAHCI